MLFSFDQARVDADREIPLLDKLARDRPQWVGVCPVCGGRFLKSPAANNPPRYCSRSCGWKYRQGRRKRQKALYDRARYLERVRREGRYWLRAESAERGES